MLPDPRSGWSLQRSARPRPGLALAAAVLSGLAGACVVGAACAARAAPSDALARAQVAAMAAAKGLQLQLIRAEVTREDWPLGRAIVRVRGPEDAVVPALPASLFGVYEGGTAGSTAAQRVRPLTQGGGRTTVVLLVQSSGAVAPILPQVRRAAAEAAASLPPDDRLALVTYGDAVQVLAQPGAAADDVGKAMETMPAAGRSVLHDGLARAFDLLESERAAPPGAGASARAVLLFSDGRDTGSGTDPEGLVDRARRAGIAVSAIGHSEMEQDGLQHLQELVQRTGGEYVAAAQPEDLAPAAKRAMTRLHELSVVEWRTHLPHDGKEHRLELILAGGATRGGPLRGTALLRTPAFSVWTVPVAGALALAILAAVLAGLRAAALRREQRRPPGTEAPPAA